MNIAHEIDSLSPKSWRILKVLLSAGKPLTRKEIAQRLQQKRLHAHDLKLLQMLEDNHFIGVEQRRRHEIQKENNSQYRFMAENYTTVFDDNPKQLRWGTMGWVYEYWINGNFESILRDAIRNTPKVEPSQKVQKPRDFKAEGYGTQYPFPSFWYRLLAWFDLYP